MKVTIIGSGNVAAAFARAIASTAGLRLQEICARNAERGSALADRYGAAHVPTPEAVSPADLYLMAVSDGAVGELSARLAAPATSVVAHTAGGLGLDALRCPTRHRGVLYPLQTFSAGRAIDFRSLPLLIEATDEVARQRIETAAASLSERVVPADSALRNRIHVAAVFACNFTNHLLARATRLLKEADIDAGLLHPLIRETLDKALAVADPATVQTGPAARHDEVTLRRHLALLAGEQDPVYTAIYQLLSNSIWETSKKT